MRHTYIYSVLIFCLLGFLSCDRGPLDPVVQLGGAPQITAPGNNTNYEVTLENIEELLANFTWTGADFGFDAAVTYNLQIDLAGANFESPITLANVNTLNSDVLKSQVNTVLLSKGIVDDATADAEIRVVATISSEVEPLISDPITITVKTVFVEIEFPDVFLPGDYQGWDPPSAFAIFSRDSDNVFQGFNFFSQDMANFKFTADRNWDTNWGDDDPADGTLDMGGLDNNLATGGEAGIYMLSADLNLLTYEIVPTSWAVIGSATPAGESTDTPLIYNEELNSLFVTLDLVPGWLKFRANGNWDINFGDDGANLKLDLGGENIMIEEAGNYTIELRILNIAENTYRVVKN